MRKLFKEKIWIFKGIRKIGLLFIILIAAVFIIENFTYSKRGDPQIITVSTIKKIINVSELSTFTAVYNGIAKSENNDKANEIDYYVSYDAKVNAGIDFEEIEISVDDEKKIIDIDIPEIEITEINVDISSLDFIFYNEKANVSALTQQAYKLCEDDVENESKNQSAIYELAEQNAINILTALTKPIVEQLDDEYILIIE